MSTEKDLKFMTRALELARLAAERGDVPVGAVIVKGGEIISEGYNLREAEGKATAHAEMVAIDRACERLGGWHLCGCTLYVTLEPCPMCAGALINSRVERVVFGLRDAKAGCVGSVLNINRYPFNHAFDVTEGVLAEESAKLLSDFFAKKRMK